LTSQVVPAEREIRRTSWTDHPEGLQSISYFPCALQHQYLLLYFHRDYAFLFSIFSVLAQFKVSDRVYGPVLPTSESCISPILTFFSLTIFSGGHKPNFAFIGIC
jgi:hypothetical protein